MTPRVKLTAIADLFVIETNYSNPYLTTICTQNIPSVNDKSKPGRGWKKNKDKLSLMKSYDRASVKLPV